MYKLKHHWRPGIHTHTHTSSHIHKHPYLMLPLATPIHTGRHTKHSSRCVSLIRLLQKEPATLPQTRERGHAPACSQLCVIRCLKPPFFMDGSKSSWKFKMNMITTPSSFFTGTTSTKHGLHVPERPRDTDTDRREREWTEWQRRQQAEMFEYKIQHKYSLVFMKSCL